MAGADVLKPQPAFTTHTHVLYRVPSKKVGFPTSCIYVGGEVQVLSIRNLLTRNSRV